MHSLSEMTHSLTHLFQSISRVWPHRAVINLGLLMLALGLVQTLHAQTLVDNESAKVIQSTDHTLPPLIEHLCEIYSQSLKGATPLAARHGLLHWHTGESSHWNLPAERFTLDHWRNLTPDDQTRIWKNRSFQDILSAPRFADQFVQRYPINRELPKTLPINFEPGRIRDEGFFKRLYGSTRAEVRSNLTTILWGKQKLRVTKLYRIHERLQQIYSELRKLPKRFKKYYEPSAGAYTWRTIKGTTRLSVHSFGAAIDIGVKYSNYWRWTQKVYGHQPDGSIPYKNSFPQEIISIFERHGFIWGGWWYHHDTMHFEYRPELLIDIPKH